MCQIDHISDHQGELWDDRDQGADPRGGEHQCGQKQQVRQLS